jgi:hypothetical protein
MTKTITLTVPRHGLSTGKASPSYKTNGFSGTACRSASEFLDKALGSITEDVATSDLYETEEDVERLNLGEGGQLDG